MLMPQMLDVLLQPLRMSTSPSDGICTLAPDETLTMPQVPHKKQLTCRPCLPSGHLIQHGIREAVDCARRGTLRGRLPELRGRAVIAHRVSLQGERSRLSYWVFMRPGRDVR